MECTPLHDETQKMPPFLPQHPIHPNRCFVTISFAQSLDGSIAKERGETTLISGAESMHMTHRLRTFHKGILVGIGTVLADDPSLTVRLVEGEQPQPIILDSKLRFPTDAKLLRHPNRPWICTTKSADPQKRQRLEALGVRVVPIECTPNGSLSLPHLLVFLRAQGIDNVMVEGGSRVISAFLQAQCADHIIVTIAPKLLGGLNAIEHLSETNVPTLKEVQYQQCGSDMVLSAALVW